LDSSGERLLRKPITGIFDCCPWAATDEANNPLRMVKNSRRLMDILPTVRKRNFALVRTRKLSKVPLKSAVEKL
jgi:hypothetical protein